MPRNCLCSSRMALGKPRLLLEHICQDVVKHGKVSVMIHHGSPQDLLLLGRHKAHHSSVPDGSVLCLTFSVHLQDTRHLKTLSRCRVPLQTCWPRDPMPSEIQACCL